MSLFVLSVVTVLVVSAVCSLSEAALYSVRLPYVRRLAESGDVSGIVLRRFKENMERPIAAILILNTAANTAGAAVAGAMAASLFGEHALIAFSITFTLSVLFLSEIVPKILGVAYHRPIATTIAVPLNAAVTALYPMIRLVEGFSRWLKPGGRVMAAPEDEVRHFAMLSAEEGSIMRFEAELVKNVLALDRVTARDIMTPRPVVVKLDEELSVQEAREQIEEWTYSRIPLYSSRNPEEWTGIVFSRDILMALAKDAFDTRLSSLAKPLDFVSEKTPGHVLLSQFLKKKRHLAAVEDEYRNVAGIVTLEDILESVIGAEIVDEVDTTDDLQELAKRQVRARPRKERKKRRHADQDNGEA